MSERNMTKQFKNVRVDDDRTPSFQERAQRAARIHRVREDRINSTIGQGHPERDKPQSVWRRMLKTGGTVVAVAGFTVGLIHANKAPSPTNEIDLTVQPGEGLMSLADRANADDVNLLPIVDQMEHQPEVEDGLIAGERVSVPVVRPETHRK